MGKSTKYILQSTANKVMKDMMKRKEGGTLFTGCSSVLPPAYKALQNLLVRSPISDLLVHNTIS